MLETILLLGLPISRMGMADTLRFCRERAEKGQGGGVAFVNVHSMTESQSNPELGDSLRGMLLCCPDGKPLDWLSRALKTPIQEKVSGPDFMRLMLETCSSETHGFIGSDAETIQKIESRFNIKGISYAPPFRPFSAQNAEEDWNHFLDLCPQRKPPRYIWIGLGAPKQEYWIRHVSHLDAAPLFFGVGAAFDFLSGNVPRAPEWMRENGLEWVHRLSQEPQRLLGRYLKTNLRFMVLSARELLKK